MNPLILACPRGPFRLTCLNVSSGKPCFIPCPFSSLGPWSFPSMPPGWTFPKKVSDSQSSWPLFRPCRVSTTFWCTFDPAWWPTGTIPWRCNESKHGGRVTDLLLRSVVVVVVVMVLVLVQKSPLLPMLGTHVDPPPRKPIAKRNGIIERRIIVQW